MSKRTQNMRTEAHALKGMPVRVRGTIRSRGVDQIIVPMSIKEESISLENLIEELKRQVENLPLGIVLHGWGSDFAKEFFKALCPLLRSEDAVWLVPACESQSSDFSPEKERVVVLDTSRKVDSHIYHKLAHDLVFFSATEGKEVKEVAQFQQRARAVVVDSRGSYSNEVLWGGCEAKLVIYRLVRDEMLEEYDGCEGLRRLPDYQDYSEEDSFDLVGQGLKAMAGYLEDGGDRRIQFGSLIDHLNETYSNLPKWKEYLVRQAHEHNLPSWAVECLNVYVPLEKLRGGGKRAYICRYAYESLVSPRLPEGANELCHRKIIEVTLNQDKAELIESVAAPIFEKNLRENRSSDQAFVGALIHAMVEIEDKMNEPQVIDMLRAARNEFYIQAVTGRR